MEVKMLKGRVLVKMDAPRKLSNTIVGLERWEDYPNEGTVMAVGEDVEELEPGMRVVLDVKTSVHERLSLKDGRYIEGPAFSRTKSRGDLVVGIIEED